MNMDVSQSVPNLRAAVEAALLRLVQGAPALTGGPAGAPVSDAGAASGASTGGAATAASSNAHAQNQEQNP